MMTKIKTEPINVSNTTLSLKAGRRHRKFDVKQAKRHDYGEAHCVVCDVVFTKHHWRKTFCSEECKKKKRQAYYRNYRKENPEKVRAYTRKYREKNPEKVRAKDRKYREENLEKIKARQRKHYEKNREKITAHSRKYREENAEKIRARERERYHAKKKEEKEE
jgi:hypothetical protein